MKKFKILALMFSILLLVSCIEMRNISPGFIGKILTPSGYDKKIYSAGQVDIGDLQNGVGNSLVILEATTKTVKESFYTPKKEGDEDHSVRSKDGTPLNVDIYIQIGIPSDDETRNAAFGSITPTADKNDSRVYYIMLEDIYNQFAQMIIRGKVREIFARYNSASEVMQNYEKINKEISLMVISVLEKSKAPFNLINVQLSNVKEDETILKSKNKILEAENEAAAIDKIGASLRKNPEYLELQKIKVYEMASAKAANVTFMISDKQNPSYTVPIR